MGNQRRRSSCVPDSDRFTESVIHVSGMDPLAGHPLAYGDRVVWLIGAQPRPRRVPNPHHLEVARRPNPHLAMGRGADHCIGAPFARIVLLAMLYALTARVRRIAQLAPPNTVTRSSNGSCRSLCVLRRAAASRLASRWRFSESPPLRTSSAGESAVYAIEIRRIRVHLGTLRNGARREAQTRRANFLRILEAPPGFEPGMEVLQTSALPLGDGADIRLVRVDKIAR